MNYKLPNFLIVGAPKAGTTSLYYYLRQHPQIFLSGVKEPFFLSFAGEKFNDKDRITPSIITDYQKYLALFKDSYKYRAVGEASTFYLYFYQKTINNIKKYIPEYSRMKIIILLIGY